MRRLLVLVALTFTVQSSAAAVKGTTMTTVAGSWRSVAVKGRLHFTVYLPTGYGSSGLRYPVELLLDLLSSGMTPDEILNDYPDLEREDLLAALAFAARLRQTKRLQPTGP